MLMVIVSVLLTFWHTWILIPSQYKTNNDTWFSPQSISEVLVAIPGPPHSLLPLHLFFLSFLLSVPLSSPICLISSAPILSFSLLSLSSHSVAQTRPSSALSPLICDNRHQPCLSTEPWECQSACHLKNWLFYCCTLSTLLFLHLSPNRSMI